MTTSNFLSNTTFTDSSLTIPNAVENPGLFTTVNPDDIQSSGYSISAINAFRIFVCAFGVLGNLFVVSMILLLAEFKKGVTHWYILQLAIADSAFLLTLPFQVVEDVHHEWIFSDGMCKAKEAVLFINYYSSITFLTVMAIDRYIAICHAFSDRLQRFRTHFAAYVITAVIWIVSISITVPIMLYSTKRGHEPHCKCELLFPDPDELSPAEQCAKEGAGPNSPFHDNCVSFLEKLKAPCGPPLPSGSVDVSPPAINQTVPTTDLLYPGCHYSGYTPGFKGLLYFDFFAMFIAPFIIIAACYGLIVRHLINTRFRSDSNSSRSTSKTKDDRDRNRVVVMCATLVIVFVVCWLPYHAVHLAKLKSIVGASTDFCLKLSAATTLIAYINSAINPYIYFIGARFKSQLGRVKNSKAATTLISMFTRSRADSAGVSGSEPISQTDRRKHTASTNENSKMVQEASTGV